METTQITPGTIVVAVDGSPSADRALVWAVRQALREHRPLTLLHALGPSQAIWLDQGLLDQRTWTEARLPDAHKVLADAHEQVSRRAPELEVSEVLRLTDPRQALLEMSDGAAMVVVGSRGRGPVASLLLGSVSAAVTRHARCPVVVVRPGNRGRVRQGVLVGIDGGERSAPTLEFGYRQASLHGLPLTVMHCFWNHPSGELNVPVVDEDRLEDARLLVAESISGMTEKFPDVHVRTELERGLADDSLLRAAERMDLVVVGAHHGGTLSAAMRGSVATSVVEHATCPVAVVPATRAG